MIEKPTDQQCDTLIQYANELIFDMNQLIINLSAISNEPDEALSLILNKAKQMKNEAIALKTSLNTVKNFKK